MKWQVNEMKNLTLCAEWTDEMKAYRLYWTDSPATTITYEADIGVIRYLAAIIGLNVITVK